MKKIYNILFVLLAGLSFVACSNEVDDVFDKSSADRIQEAINADLDNMWNVVPEAIQTILRREGYEKPYETLKALTRTNSVVDANSIAEFIDTLKVSDEVKAELKRITPHTYTGY